MEKLKVWFKENVTPYWGSIVCVGIVVIAMTTLLVLMLPYMRP